jgi:hypothetical protein
MEITITPGNIEDSLEKIAATRAPGSAAKAGHECNHVDCPGDACA